VKTLTAEAWSLFAPDSCGFCDPEFMQSCVPPPPALNDHFASTVIRFFHELIR
jgi:hypothetical protein